MFGPTELMDMMTRGQYSKDLALFEKSLANDGLSPAPGVQTPHLDNNRQESTVNARGPARRALAADNNAEGCDEDDNDRSDGEQATSDDSRCHGPRAIVPNTAGHDGDEQDDDMDDNLYLWCPDGSV